MVTFATPPREPNEWFLPPEPPPLSSLTLPAAQPSGGTGRRRMLWPVSALLLLAVTAIGVVAQLPAEPVIPADSFARNRIEAQAHRLLLAQLPPTPRLGDVRRVMGQAQLFCQDALGAGSDSLLTCLGHAVRYNGAYSRMAFRIVSRGDSVTQVITCPALVVHRAMPSADLRRRASATLADPSCWRDPANPAYSDWVWTSLPDKARFTLVPVPDAPRMRVESAPTADTITVLW